MRDSESPIRILVYIGPHGDDAIGENLIKLPFMRAIRDAYPQGEISWIQGHHPLSFQSSLEPLARGLITEVIPDTALGNTWGSALGFTRLLPNHHFDVIIDTQKHPKFTLALRRISHDLFISSTWSFALSSRCPKGRKLKSGTLTERLLQLLDLVKEGLTWPDSKADIPTEYVEAAEQALPSGQNYIGLAPGAGRKDSGKCWPLKNFITVAKQQIIMGRKPVFFLGPDELPWKEIIINEIPDVQIAPLELEAADGNTLSGPGVTVVLGGRLDVGVANCSGTGHMLAAGGASMVSLYGPTSPTKFAPYTKDITIIKAQDFGGSSIELIPVEVVNEGIESQLKEMALS
ncbi:MAG: glycosyltransferase family 9 protein [Rhodospirillales bacterium]|jgi:ADP-heptose:LPS heptosyltransferase|nr:glycosyltransferase family 9 protein [Rhodospirillales bacterium]